MISIYKSEARTGDGLTVDILAEPVHDSPQRLYVAIGQGSDNTLSDTHTAHSHRRIEEAHRLARRKIVRKIPSKD
jgi:hypothetical protein